MSRGAKWGVGILVVLVVAAMQKGKDVAATAAKAQSDSTRAGQAFARGDSADASSSASAQSAWHVHEEENAMDGSKTVSAMIDADAQVEGWLRSERPILVVRCAEKKTSLYMVTGMAASVERDADLDDHTVRLRYDDGPPVSQTWSESTDDKALFAADPISTARRIARAKTLRVQFTPFRASPVIATFDVRGLDQHLAKIASACGWKA